MNGNESNMNISTDDSIVKQENEIKIDEQIKDVTINRDFVPNEEKEVPPTPEFSDSYDESQSNNIEDGQIINIAGMDYSKLFDTYKQLFENITEDIDNINNKITKLSELTDNNIKETNAAIKATQIYSKLFTKLSFGINIILFIAIIVLFIIK